MPSRNCNRTFENDPFEQVLYLGGRRSSEGVGSFQMKSTIKSVRAILGLVFASFVEEDPEATSGPVEGAPGLAALRGPAVLWSRVLRRRTTAAGPRRSPVTFQWTQGRPTADFVATTTTSSAAHANEARAAPKWPPTSLTADRLSRRRGRDDLGYRASHGIVGCSVQFWFVIIQSHVTDPAGNHVVPRLL